MEFQDTGDVMRYRDALLEATSNTIWIARSMFDAISTFPMFAEMGRLSAIEQSKEFVPLSLDPYIDAINQVSSTLPCQIPDSIKTAIEAEIVNGSRLPELYNPASCYGSNIEIAHQILLREFSFKGTLQEYLDSAWSELYNITWILLPYDRIPPRNVIFSDWQGLNESLVKSIRKEFACILKHFPETKWSEPLTYRQLQLICSPDGSPLSQETIRLRFRSGKLRQHPNDTGKKSFRVNVADLPMNYRSKLNPS